MNKPRPIYNKDGELTGYKQEVKWRNQRRYFTRRTAAAAEKAWANAIADFEAGKEPYDRYKLERPGGVEAADQEPAVETFESWLLRWHAKRRLGPDTRISQTSWIRSRLIPDLGHLRLTNDEMTRAEIQEWVWELEDEYSSRYIASLLGVVRVASGDHHRRALPGVVPGQFQAQPGGAADDHDRTHRRSPSSTFEARYSQSRANR